MHLKDFKSGYLCPGYARFSRKGFAMNSNCCFEFKQDKVGDS